MDRGPILPYSVKPLRMRDYVLRGAAIGGATFVAISIGAASVASVAKPSLAPAPTAFWWLSAYPLLAIAAAVLSEDNFVERRLLILAAAISWIAVGSVAGAIIGRSKRKSHDQKNEEEA